MQIVLRDVVKDFLKRNAKHKIECDNIDELLDENFVEVKITEMYSALKDGQTGFIQRYKFNKYEYMIGKTEFLYDIRSVAHGEYLQLCSKYSELANNASLEKKFPFEKFLQKKMEEYKNYYEFVDEYTFIDEFPINKYIDIKNLSQLKKLNREKYREVDFSLLKKYFAKMIENYGVEYAVEAKRYYENKLNEISKNKYIDLNSEKSIKGKEYINAKYTVKANIIKNIINKLSDISQSKDFNTNKNIEKL